MIRVPGQPLTLGVLNQEDVMGDWAGPAEEQRPKVAWLDPEEVAAFGMGNPKVDLQPVGIALVRQPDDHILLPDRLHVAVDLATGAMIEPGSAFGMQTISTSLTVARRLRIEPATSILRQRGSRPATILAASLSAVAKGIIAPRRGRGGSPQAPGLRSADDTGAGF